MYTDARKKSRVTEYKDIRGILLSYYMANIYTGRPLVYILYYMC